MNRHDRRASHSNGKSMMRQGWNDFEDCTDEAMLMPSFKKMRNPPAAVLKNNLYIVQAWLKEESRFGLVTRVGIRRNDSAAIHSWSDIFKIKNQLFGDETVAFEIFPKVSELFDVANMYWIFVLPMGEPSPVYTRK